VAYGLDAILSSFPFAGRTFFATFASRFGGNGCAEKPVNDGVRGD